jgi:hypothetical protein
VYMSNIDIIRDEITNDPLGRGYSGMDDAAVAVDLNTVYRTINKSSLSGDELFAATDSTEFAALTDHQESLWVAFCGRSSVDPFGSSNVAFVQYIFGGGSTTVSNLNSLRTQSVSRGAELGVGSVRPGDVLQARL